MGNTIPKRPPVSSGKTRICVTGYGISHNVNRAKKLAESIAEKHPDTYETWFHFDTFKFKEILAEILNEIPVEQKSKPSTLDKGKTIGEHTSAPFVWFERGGEFESDGETIKGKTYEAIGGRDKFCEWAGKEFEGVKSIESLSSIDSPPLSEIFFTSDGGTWNKKE